MLQIKISLMRIKILKFGMMPIADPDPAPVRICDVSLTQLFP